MNPIPQFSMLTLCAALAVAPATSGAASTAILRTGTPGAAAPAPAPMPICGSEDEDSHSGLPDQPEDRDNDEEEDTEEDVEEDEEEPEPENPVDPDSGGDGEGPVSSEIFLREAALLRPGSPERLFLADCHNQPQFAGPGLTAAATADVATSLQDSTRFCGWLPAGVRVDCIASRFRAAARELPRSGAYAPARAALLAGARDLERIAARNAGRGVPRKVFVVTPPGGGPVERSAPLREVPPSRAAATNAAALAVIEETRTVLLRSTENSRTRMLHYQDIAAAVDSTKVLLRSS